MATSIEICIKEKRGVKLDQTALCRLVRGEPFFNFHSDPSLSKTDALGANSYSLLQNVEKSVLCKTDDDQRTSNSEEHKADDLDRVFIFRNDFFVGFICF